MIRHNIIALRGSIANQISIMMRVLNFLKINSPFPGVRRDSCRLKTKVHETDGESSDNIADVTENSVN